MTYRVLDLFSGIGGFSLGLERTGGFKTVAFCEIDSYCRKILAKHWPEVPIFDDIKKVAADAESVGCGQGWAWGTVADSQDGASKGRTGCVGPIDVICGGFPCQDISLAGKGAGIEGARSGLWSEYSRVIGELRPKYAIVENVAALLNRGLDRVLGDLAALGYNAEWHCIPAAAVGAPHRRDRIWIVAYPDSEGESGSAINGEMARLLAYPDRTGLEGVHEARGEIDLRSDEGSLWRQWATEPDVGRLAHGVPARVDRLRALGNAVVPQVVELIGRAILQAGAP